MIAVWVPGAALSAVHRTKMAIMISPRRRQPSLQPTYLAASRKPTSGRQQQPLQKSGTHDRKCEPTVHLPAGTAR